jgi:hypothetical protein
MIKIKISATLANEYDASGIHDFIGQKGTYQLTREQAIELLEDAKFNFFHTDAPVGISRAYGALISNLLAAIEA